MDDFRYAKSVIEVLRRHFPDLADPDAAGIITDAVRRQACTPRDGFEVIVDDPWTANWRLTPLRKDRRRVHLACYRITRRDSDTQLAHTVNEALSALETPKQAAASDKPAKETAR